MLNTSDFGRRFSSGLRWQWMHHSMSRVFDWNVRFILSIRPWHDSHPTPLAMWIEWLK